MVPCRSMPAAKSRWMTWSCRSWAMRSRSASTVSSRACSRAVARVSATAAWSAKSLIKSRCRASNGRWSLLRATAITPRTRLSARKWHHDRGPLPDVGERLDRVVKRFGDQWSAGTEDGAGGGVVNRYSLAQHLLGVHAHRGGHDQGVHLVDGQVGVDGNEDDGLLGACQRTRTVGDQLQRPVAQVRSGEQRRW